MTPDLHYTSEAMVKDLLVLVPMQAGDRVLDAGSGRNKVWFKNLPKDVLRSECELEDGDDFYDHILEEDWVIGNPPFHESWKFTEHALKIARKGVCWLVNTQALNSHLTAPRLARMHELGFHYTHIRVVADKRWYGRYYFLILEKKPDTGLISWERKTY